jgi:hypothetical protein
MLVCLGVLPTHAEKRVALVIGNDRYLNLPAGQQLRKAVNDSRAVGDALSARAATPLCAAEARRTAGSSPAIERLPKRPVARTQRSEMRERRSRITQASHLGAHAPL